MKKKEIYVLAHNIRSLHNIGSIFRTCDAVGVTKLYLTGYSGVPPRKEISKTALDADKFVSWEYHKDPLELIKKMKELSFQIISLEKNQLSQNIMDFSPSYPLCLILGNEIEGVEKPLLDLSDNILHIPMNGKKESLNVSVAFGIAVYCLKR